MGRKYQRRQPNRPTKNLSDREVLIQASLRSLYADQYEFWQKRLTLLIKKNNETLGKDCHPRESALHYAGKVWFRPWMEATEASDFKISHVHPEHEKEAIEVTSELAELETEQYEVGRFLAGLLLFQAPVLEIKRALGPELVDEIERGEKVSFDSLGTSAGVMQNQTTALKLFVEEHAYVVEMMTERILGKMILSQSIMGVDSE